MAHFALIGALCFLSFLLGAAGMRLKLHEEHTKAMREVQDIAGKFAEMYLAISQVYSLLRKNYH